MHRRLLARVRAVNIWLMAPLLGLSVFLAVFISMVAPAKAASTSSNLNFQARLMGSNGTVVDDGNYNIDFKLYTADSTTGTVGTCTGSCVWEETRKNSNSQGVQVINGYFSVNLGSVTAFPSTINWDQQLWLTMNIGGVTTSSSVTWDGEMQNNGHSIPLTALPYSFVAGQLAKTSGSNRGTLAFNTVANNPNILLPDASGTVCLQASSSCGFLQGSGTAFLQNGNAFGGVGTLGTTDSYGLNLITNGHTVASLSSGGAAEFENYSNSANAFQIQDAGGSNQYFNVDTLDSIIDADASTVNIASTNADHTINIGAGGVGGSYVFPQDAVIDSFTRGNNSTLGSNWAGPIISTDSSTWQLNSDQALDNHFGGGADNYRTDISSADSEAYFTIEVTGEYGVWARVQNPGTSTYSGYLLDWSSSSGTLQLYKAVSGSLTAIGSTASVSQVVGDQMGISVIGSTVTGYVNTGSGWVEELQLSDSSVSGAGTTGITAFQQNDRIDDFGGGGVTVTTGTNQAVTVGSANGTSSLLLQGGSGNIMLSSTASTIVKPTAGGDSATAFEVQPSGSTTPVFDVDTSHGYVGIGTSAPGSALDVRGAGNFQNTSTQELVVQSGAFTKTFVVNTQNNVVGIGAAPSGSGATLQVAGSASVNAASTTAFQVLNSTTNVMQVDSSNTRVGIGNASAPIATLQVERSTYTSNEVVINNGTAGAPPTYPNSWLPTLVVNSSETSSSRPLFFGYSSGGAWASMLTAGACGSFSQMCLDLGTTNAATALENVGNVLQVGWGNDGNFSSGVSLNSTTTVTSGGTFSALGTAVFKASGGSASAFQVQDNGGAAVLSVDTSADRVGIGATPANYLLTIGTNTTTNSGGIIFGTDTQADLFRFGSGSLKTDGNFYATGEVNAGDIRTNTIDSQSGGTAALTITAHATSIISQGTTIKTSAAGIASAFQVQDNNSNNVFNVDTLNDHINLGLASNVTADMILHNASGSGSITLTPANPGSSTYTITVPAETGTICTTAASAACTAAYGSGTGVFLGKNSTDTSSAAAGSGYLYAFTNSSSAASGGVLQLDNGNNTGSALYVTGTGAPASGSALIYAQNTSASPSGNLLDLRSGSAPTSKFSVDAAGDVQVAGNITSVQNSLNALQVQNSSGSTYLNVDTTDGYVINNGTVSLGNELQNPGFEAGGTTSGSGWFTPSASQVITTSSANAHSGNNEMVVTGDSTTHAVYTKYYAVSPGDTIYAEGYVKNSAGANGDGGIYLEFSDKDKGGQIYSTADTGLPGTSYILKSITATAPSGKYYVRLALSVKATATTGSFYFDDMYLRRANQQAPLLISNSSSAAFQVQNSSSQTVLGVDASANKLFSGLPDGASAVGFTLNTTNAYSTSGAKLISIQNNSSEKFSIDKDGNINNSGGVSAGGGISAGGDISTTGNVNIATGKNYEINGSQITSQALSDANTLAYLAGTGPQTFTGNNKFTGTVLVQNGNAAGFQVQSSTVNVMTVDTSGNKTVLGTAGGSGLTADLQFNYNGSAGSISLAPLDPSSTNYTLNLPSENGTICTSAATSPANCTNFASASSVTSGLNGKLNKNSVDTSAAAVTALQGQLYSFTNNSSNIASGVISINNNTNTGNALYVTGSNDYATGKAYIVVNNTNGLPTGNLIDLQSNGSDEFTVDASGNVFANGNINIASGKLYEIGGTQISTSALSDGGQIAKTNANNTFSGNNTFSSASNSFSGSGSGLTSLNASNISSGTLDDGRLNSDVALTTRTGQTFTGDNTFAPTANNTGTTIKQTSGTATSGNILDVQTADGTGHFLQITNAAANQGAVTLQSVGASNALTIGSASGTMFITAATNTIQHNNSSLTIDVDNGTDSTLIITNAQPGVAASLSVEGDVAVGAGRVYKVGTTSGVSVNCTSGTFLQVPTAQGGIITGGNCVNAVTTIGAAGGSIGNGASISTNTLTLGYADTSNPGLVSNTTQSFNGNKTFTNNLIANSNSTTAFQVQNTSNIPFLVIDTSGNNVNVGITGVTNASETVNIANSTAGVHSVLIGSANSTSTTTIKSGTGGINLNPSGTSNTGIKVKPGTDSTAAFQVQNAGGTSTILGVDTSSSLVNIASSGKLTLDGGTGNEVLNNASGSLILANYAGNILMQTSSFEIQNTSDFSVNFSTDNNGDALFKDRVDSATAFQIQQNGSTTPVFDVDTSNKRVGINTAAPTSALTINSGTAGSSGLQFTQLNSNSSASSSFSQLLGVDSSGNVGLSSAGLSLTSPALAYWDGANNPTTLSQSYPLATLSGSGTGSTGSCTGTWAPTFVSGSGVELNPACGNTNGSMNWNFSQVSFEENQFQFKAGTGAADATWFYGYTDSIPTTEYGCNVPVASCNQTTGPFITNGYIVYFSEFHDCIGISYGGYKDGNQCNNGGGTSNSGASPLKSVSTSSLGININDNNWHQVDIQILYNVITVRWDGQVILTETDSYGRDLSHLNYGFAARSGGSTNTHFIKGLLVTKLGTNVSDYNILDIAPLTNNITTPANNMYWENSTGSLGIDTVNPSSNLDVNGTTHLGGTVNIGSTTTDGTANLLELDSYNNATDPTGVNGAMYYNTADNAFRCYQNGGWTNCASALPVSTYVTATQTIGTSATNVTNMSFSLAANTKYYFKFVVMFVTGSTSRGIAFGETDPGTPTHVSFCANIQGTLTANTAASFGSYCVATSTDAGGTGATGTTTSGSTTTTFEATVDGYIQTSGTAGTFQLRAKANSASDTLEPGSFGVLTPVQ